MLATNNFLLKAVILCTPLTRLYLINYARPLIYTTFMSYPSLAAIRASYTLMASGTAEQVYTNNSCIVFIEADINE